MCTSATMLYCILLLSIAVATQANIYLPSVNVIAKNPCGLFGCNSRRNYMLTDFMREMIDSISSKQLGNELADAPDPYFMEYPEKAKELPLELPADYDAIDTLNPNPSIRDQEYLQHSTLWSHQHINNNNNNKGNGRHRIQSAGIKGIKDEKTENPLPAYCTPPNPCPIGYTSKNNCLTNFENTATFSRDYQSAQDCMCDTEHMLECSGDSGSNNNNNLSNMQISNPDFDQIVEQFQEENPFFQGEKLPIAAKKGIHVID
ncbi:uncharacterized protein LOC105183415 [Harpegnathos saltator]|uniref:Neuroendocrine protein 7B2 n=1 Tax=Harpegnathos saltator TaxID=610380 RepID=E2BJ49_HARSA|nr:uncharacterized protein LOC105183415 [Harpegnathos saltator]XP_025159657.1 uncharacterized protein LOC105183415 [Harpegnathos saltator]EFN84199.1 hypothetical protein EAI_09987 [Harpegnathos saltator]